MKERLFLYRVNMHCRGLSVNQGIESAVLVLPHPAESPLFILDQALPGAEPALQCVVVNRLPILGLMPVRRSFRQGKAFEAV